MAGFSGTDCKIGEFCAVFMFFRAIVLSLFFLPNMSLKCCIRLIVQVMNKKKPKSKNSTE